MNSDSNALPSVETGELLRRFAEIAKIIRTALPTSLDMPDLTPERDRLERNLTTLAAEIRARRPVAAVRNLLQDESPDVRIWAGAQLHTVDPEWADAAMRSTYAGMTTVDFVALMRHVREAPPAQPSLNDMPNASLVDRFVDAATREYATRFLDCFNSKRDTDLRNRILREIADIMRELKSRDALALLLPLLENANITVRRRAATACLGIEPARASAVLETIAGATGYDNDRVSARDALASWREGKTLIAGVV